MVCLQETKLGDKSFNPGMGYSFYKSLPPTSDYAKGGTAIIINNTTQHSEVNLNTYIASGSSPCPI